MNDRLLVVLSKLRYAANAIAPPNKLPPELLRAIFSYLCPDTRRDWEVERTPPYAYLLAVSRVCRHWRDIAVSATELWTYIIFAASGNFPTEEEISIARLCTSRSGVRPLDFFYTSLHSDFLRAEELIPDRRRLRSLVYGYTDRNSGDKLVSFLLTASHLERLEIRGDASFSLPTLFSDAAPPPLRELVIARCTPWPNNQFGSLTSLILLCQKDIDANIYSLLDALRCSPHLEELLLEREFRPYTEPQQSPGLNVLPIPLHSLKKLHICRLSVRTTGRLLGALDLHSNRVFMRFTNISADLGSIFTEGVMPGVSPRIATKVELVYPSTGGMILHATNGIAYTRLAYRYLPRHCELLDWIAERPGVDHPLKELWLHIDQDVHYVVPPPSALRDLETLVIETDPNERFNLAFFLMFSPDKDGVPSPLLSTLELRNVFGVEAFGNVLKARSDAGSRLRTLRIRWFEGCEARMAPLVQFVDKLDFYRVADQKSRGLELPGECMTKSRWWEPWSRKFAGEMECEPGRWGLHEMW